MMQKKNQSFKERFCEILGLGKKTKKTFTFVKVSYIVHEGF
jgi:hypothetical protein